MEMIYSIITLFCAFSVIVMLSVYMSMEKSLGILTIVIHELISYQHRSVQHGTSIQGMAEDTEVGK